MAEKTIETNVTVNGNIGLSGVITAGKFVKISGTSRQFLKADGSLDSSTYATQSALAAVKTNAWKLDTANPECGAVVLQLSEDIGIFQSMKEQGIDYSRSRNIYIDVEKIAGLGTITNVFEGFEKLPIGVRYHLFFGNTQSSTKLNWDDKLIESNVASSVWLDANYPSAKCEFMRVTDSWTYADWEARTQSLAPAIDSGLSDNPDKDTSMLKDYMDKNSIAYDKVGTGVKVDLIGLLANIVSKQ